eukprot:Em0005g709a
MEDLESLVVKLRKRLEEASQETLQEDKVWKILTKLAQLPMSLELLQVTHIGKQVNSFKKHNGRIGQKAKELVTKWKELVPDEAPQEKRAPAQTGTTTPQGPTHTNRHRRETHSTPAQSTSSQAHAPSRGHAPIDLAVAVSAVGSSRKDKATPKATPIHTSGSWSTKDTTPIYSESESREDGYGPTNSSSSSAAKKRKECLCYLCYKQSMEFVVRLSVSTVNIRPSRYTRKVSIPNLMARHSFSTVEYRTSLGRSFLLNRWNVAGAPCSPNGIIVHRNNPHGVGNAVMWRALEPASSPLAPPFFFTITMGEHHSLDEGSMMPSLKHLLDLLLYGCPVRVWNTLVQLFSKDWFLGECGVISPYWNFFFMPIAVCLFAPVAHCGLVAWLVRTPTAHGLFTFVSYGPCRGPAIGPSNLFVDEGSSTSTTSNSLWRAFLSYHAFCCFCAFSRFSQTRSFIVSIRSRMARIRVER